MWPSKVKEQTGGRQRGNAARHLQISTITICVVLGCFYGKCGPRIALEIVLPQIDQQARMSQDDENHVTRWKVERGSR